MKQGKMTGILLGVINVILLAGCIILYLRTDRIPPEITFGTAEIIYQEGMDESRLLEGAMAYDGRDSDVSDRIVIEKIVENKTNSTVTVFYAVSDKGGNIAKASRVFQAAYTKEENQERDSEAEQLLTAGIDTELALEHIADDDETAQEGDVEETSEEEPSASPTPEPTPELASTPAPAPENTPQPAPRPQPTTDPAAPVLTLKVSEVKVMAGQGPAWVDIIGTLSDDKDNYETLFRNLSVSKYDKNKAGTYAVSVYTEDSDGNRSPSVPLNIIVR